MKKEIFKKIEIPKGVEAEIAEDTLIVRGPEGEITRTFNTDNLNLEKKDDYFIMGSKKATKREKKKMNTIASHIKNMMNGVQKKFEYQLKICYSHFPITVELQGDNAIVKNFLGEKTPRKVRIPRGADVKIDRETITVSSIDKELAGQTAANFEAATKIKKRDRRVFQDGIFIVNKAGREI